MRGAAEITEPNRGASRRGFSLLELMAALGLMALIAGWGMLSLKGTQSRQGARALATVVAEELSAARLAAMSSQNPVAVCFPSDGGRNPLSDSLYLLAGEGAPRVQRVNRYRGDFPGSLICNASWPLVAPLSADLAQPLPGSKWKNFDVARWLGACRAATPSKDYCLIFLPDGSVRSNDLPAFGGAFHIVVTSASAAFEDTAPPAGAAAGPRYCKLTSAQDCLTIRVDLGGPVTVSGGLEGLAGTLPGGPTGPMVTAVPLVPAVAPTPQVEITPSALPRINPMANETDSPGGQPVNVTVNPDGFVTLETRAEDRAGSGQRLYCAWKVTEHGSDANAVNPGVFCLSVAADRGTAMDWDALAGAWRSTWQWAPPANAAPGKVYDLRVAVQDKDGRELKAEIRPLKILPPGKVLFSSDRDGNWLCYTMNVDGTGQKRLHVFPFTEDSPRWSHEGKPSVNLDGSRVLLHAEPLPYWPVTGLRQLYITDRKGGQRTLITGSGAGPYPKLGGGQIDCPDENACACEGAALSPIGNWVAYRRHHPPTDTWDLVLRSASPGPPKWVTRLAPRQGVHFSAGGPALSPRFMNDQLSWGGDNRTLYYTRGDDSVSPPAMKIFKLDVISGTQTDVTGSFSSHGPNFRVGHLLAIAESSNGNTTITCDGAAYCGSGRQRYEMVEPWMNPGDLTWHMLTVLDTVPYPASIGAPQIFRFPIPALPGAPPAGDDSPFVQLTNNTVGNNVWPVYIR